MKKNKIKKFVVTGGAGFIGSNLVKLLLKKFNCNITVIDNFSTGFKNYLIKNPRIKIVKADLLNFKKIKKIFQNKDTIFHFAANADVRFGLQDPKKDLQQNAICTFNVLEAMRCHNIKKIVFTSTAPIYGDTNVFPTPENPPMPLQTSLYGSSKLYCESLIQSYCEGYNFQSWIYRFVSILGPNYSHGHVFDFVKSLLKNKKKLKILGDGNQKKSYLHVEDAINAILISYLKSKNKVNIFNLGTDDYLLVKDSAKLISGIMNLKPKFVFTGGNSGWIGDQPKVLLNIKKIKSLGWRNKYSIKDSIIDTTGWILNNKWILKLRK